MTSTLVPGDQVICLLRGNEIVSVYDEEWDTKNIFDVVATYDVGYLIYIPQDMVIKNSFIITGYNNKEYKVKLAFIGSSVRYITEHNIIGIYSKLDGMVCSKCGVFCKYAQVEGGETFICFTCRNYPPYKSTVDDF